MLGAPLYEVATGGAVTITGTLVPAPGTTVPSDYQLAVSIGEAGFTVAGSPNIQGNVFTLVVRAPATPAVATLVVGSPNYPLYGEASAYLVSGYANTKTPTLTPIANHWQRAKVGSDASIAWFRHATPVVDVTAAMLGTGARWLDLRFCHAVGDPFLDNLGNTPFLKPTQTSQFDTSTHTISTVSRVAALRADGAAQADAHGIGTRIGSVTVSGPGTITSQGRKPDVTGCWPSHNGATAIQAHDTVYAFLPSTLAHGSVGTAEIIHEVDGKKLGLVVHYRYA